MFQYPPPKSLLRTVPPYSCVFYRLPLRMQSVLVRRCPILSEPVLTLSDLVRPLVLCLHWQFISAIYIHHPCFCQLQIATAAVWRNSPPSHQPPRVPSFRYSCPRSNLPSRPERNGKKSGNASQMKALRSATTPFAGQCTASAINTRYPRREAEKVWRSQRVMLKMAQATCRMIRLPISEKWKRRGLVFIFEGLRV
jgi:hypothetical protein